MNDGGRGSTRRSVLTINEVLKEEGSPNVFVTHLLACVLLCCGFVGLGVLYVTMRG